MKIFIGGRTKWILVEKVVAAAPSVRSPHAIVLISENRRIQ
jgi:hypothetical protein